MAPHGDRAVRVRAHVLTPSCPSRPGRAPRRAARDRAGEQLGPARRNDETAAGRADETRRLAVLVGCDDDRARDREDSADAAPDDVARETARKTDDVHAPRTARTRARPAAGDPGRRRRPRAERAREPLQLGPPDTTADDRHHDVVEVAQERRGAKPATSGYGPSPTLPECMTTNLPVSPRRPRPLVVVRTRLERSRVDPVGDDRDPRDLRPSATRRPSSCLRSRPPRSAPPQVRTNERPQDGDDDEVSTLRRATAVSGTRPG